jgi:hypothetical protein
MPAPAGMRDSQSAVFEIEITDVTKTYTFHFKLQLKIELQAVFSL